MREHRAQIVMLVRAFEETDREGHIVPLHIRELATRRALMVTGMADERSTSPMARNIRYAETVERRARVLFDALGRRRRVLHNILRVARLGAGTTPFVVIVAFLLGWMTNVIGPQREVHLLSFLLLALFAWNLLAYVATGVAALFRRLTGAAGPLKDLESRRQRLTGKLAGLFLRGALWRRLHARRIARALGPYELRLTAKAILRFGALWHRLAGPLLGARVRRTLHLGAIGLVAGVIGGMYLGGYVFEYPATWGSRWLSAAQVQWALEVLLGPAARLLGEAVPEIAGLRNPGAGGPAEIWVRLYAVTALLFVGIPRAALALMEGWESRILAANLPVDLGEPYFRRVFTPWRGAARHVLVVPYEYRPPIPVRSTLKTLLQDFYGARAEIVFFEGLGRRGDASGLPAEFGGGSGAPDDAEPRGVDACETSVVLLLSTAGPAEPETDAPLLADLKRRLAERRVNLMVLIERSSDRRRVRGPVREERIQDWLAIVEAAGLRAAPIALDRPLGDESLSAIRDAIWRADPIGETG